MQQPRILKKIKDINLSKKILVILLIVFMFSQYLVIPTYANIEKGFFTHEEYPYDIEFVRIDVGYHSMAIDKDGSLWTWGLDQDGQLGTNKVHSNGNISTSSGLATTTPERIMNGTKFSEISTGEKYSMAIDIDGNLWTWGNNEYGQLGNGTKNNLAVPTQIKKETKFKKIAASRDVSMAIDIEGNLWVWGSNKNGCLGRDGLDSYKPEKLKEGTKFIEIGSNLSQCLAIDEDYNLWGWGDKNKGDSLSGTTDAIYPAPIQIKNETKFKEITSSDYLIALDVSGNIWTWGNEEYDYEMSEPKIKETGKTFSHIGNSMAIDTEGRLWTWGDNHWGKLGNGSYTSSESLIQINDGIKFKKLNGNNSSSTSAAIDSDGNTWTWGLNLYGGLGIGKVSTQGVTTPQQITHKIKSFTVTFINYDNTKLQETTVKEGQKASYTGSIPTKNIKGYTSRFTGWSPDLSTTAITENTTFTAQFDDTLNNYNLTYTGIDGATFISNNPSTYTVETNSFTLNNPSKEGYTFAGWEGTDITGKSTAVMVTKGSVGDRTYNAVWNANTNTPYKIEHYKQKLDGSYSNTPDEEEEKIGTTGSSVTAEQKKYNGYIYDIGKSVPTGVIAGDGSLVLKLYYKANTNTEYKVEHYKQRADGSYGSTADETENLSGTTGASVTAKAKAYEGYTEDTTNANRVASGTIAGDGSLVLKLYYKLEPKEVKTADIIIKNIDKQNKNGIQKSRIEIYKDGKLMGSALTDENGNVEFKNLEPGEYIYKQSSVENDYILNTEEYKFVVKEDGTVEFLAGNGIVENDKNKKDNDTNDDNNKNNTNDTETVNNNKGSKQGDTTTAKNALLYAGARYGKCVILIILGILSFIVINKSKKIK